MGLDAVTLADLAEYIRVVRGLLRQETLEWDYAGQRRAIRFLNPELELINLTDAIPFYISAFGPRGKALTARLGAGWIYGVRNAEQAVAQLQLMQQAWRQAGRDPSALYAVAQGSGCVLANGEPYDSQRAKAQAGPSAVMVMHDLAEAEERRTLGHRFPDDLQPLFAAFQEIYAQYTPRDARYLQVHRWHLMRLRPEEEPLIRALRDAGYAQFAAHIRYGHETMVEDWAEILAGV
jgi:5,10-methylenetetrahydromethanopterin reductase